MRAIGANLQVLLPMLVVPVILGILVPAGLVWATQRFVGSSGELQQLLPTGVAALHHRRLDRGALATIGPVIPSPTNQRGRSVAPHGRPLLGGTLRWEPTCTHPGHDTLLDVRHAPPPFRRRR